MLPVRVYVTRRMFKSQICEELEFARDTYPPVLRHIGEVHSFEPNFHVVCGLILDSTQAVCSATYSNYRSFWSHIYSKHRQVMNHHSTTQPLWRRLQRGPVECVLGRCYAQNSNGKSICTNDCFYDVPLIEFLWRLLKCTEVHKQVCIYHSCIVNWQVIQI